MILQVTDGNVTTFVPIGQVVCWQIFDPPVERVNKKTKESRASYGELVVPIRGAIPIWSKEEADAIAAVLVATMG